MSKVCKKINSIFFEIDRTNNTYWTAGSGSFLNEIANILNVDNIFENIGKWGQVEEELIVKRNPDFIVYCNNDKNDKSIETMYSNRPGWQNVSAVKNNKISQIENDIISRPGPRIIDAINILYSEINS